MTGLKFFEIQLCLLLNSFNLLRFLFYCMTVNKNLSHAVNNMRHTTTYNNTYLFMKYICIHTCVYARCYCPVISTTITDFIHSRPSWGPPTDPPPHPPSPTPKNPPLPHRTHITTICYRGVKGALNSDPGGVMRRFYAKISQREILGKASARVA